MVGRPHLEMRLSSDVSEQEVPFVYTGCTEVNWPSGLLLFVLR